jgi:hypothetical protein
MAGLLSHVAVYSIFLGPVFEMYAVYSVFWKIYCVTFYFENGYYWILMDIILVENYRNQTEQKNEINQKEQSLNKP